MTLIEASYLRKVFNETVVVDDVNLTIAAGEINGLVGSDGAGKATTLRLIVSDCKIQPVADHQVT